MLKKIRILTFCLLVMLDPLFSQPSQKVLIEEGTGTWCAWCPQGRVVGGEMLEKYGDDLIFIEVHGNDPMENSEYDDSCSFYLYPSGHVNRKQENLLTGQWEGAFIKELNETPSANVTVETLYDTLSRTLTVNASAEFFEDITGDYRFSAIVVEDGIMGNDESYDQANVFANNARGSMGGFEKLPSQVPYNLMVYDHVGREILGGYNGEARSIPSEMVTGETYTHSFSWNLPDEYKAEYVWVAVLLINNENGQVVNADKSIYILGNENAKPFFVPQKNLQAFRGFEYERDVRYYDCDDDSYQLEVLEPLPSWLTLRRGQLGFATLLGTPNSLGSYDLAFRVTDGTYSVEERFKIEVIDSIQPDRTELKDDFLILPNPNNGVFVLEYDRGYQYQIFDRYGRVVADGIVVRDMDNQRFSFPIDISGEPTGLYLLKVLDYDGYTKTKKLFVFGD